MSNPATDLYGLSDEDLEAERLRAEAQEKAYRNRAYECRFHQLLRRQARNAVLREQIQSLRAQADLIETMVREASHADNF